jgi:cystathionine beta-lyase/cystathionine gamma-synthase
MSDPNPSSGPLSTSIPDALTTILRGWKASLGLLLHNPCLTYSSGLAALNAVITFLAPKRVAIGAGYHGCHGVLRLHEKLSELKILPLECKPKDLQEGDLLHLETPVNPTGVAFNIQHYADVAHSRGAYLSVDATLAPPPLQDPFKHGADIHALRDKIHWRTF